MSLQYTLDEVQAELGTDRDDLRFIGDFDPNGLDRFARKADGAETAFVSSFVTMACA